MEHFIERLDTVLDTDPFIEIDWNLLSPTDYELLEKYRLKHLEERKRIREERKTKNFEEIMEDLLQELSHKPDISSFYRTLDEPVPTMNSINQDVHTIELDTSDDEQDDLEHCTTWIDPSKSIGRSVANDELQASTYIIHPLAKSPSPPPPPRRLHRYVDQARRNTYTLQNPPSSDDDGKQLVNTKHEYVRLDSQGFDLQQPQENPFQNVKDARSTFSLPQKRVRFTHREAQNLLHKKLGAYIKGHLTRQLFRTEHVQRLIQTLHDTQKFAVDFQTQCLQTKTKLDPEDINIIDQLIKKVESVLHEIHAIFAQYSTAHQISMIVRQGHSQQLRTIRTNQRIAKDFSTERPIIDPLPISTGKNENSSRQTHYRRPETVRRHVTTVPNRAPRSTTHTRPHPLKKAASVQRNSRPLSSNKNESISNPPRSSSANNNTYRPPLRLAPASPMFRNRLK